MDQKKFQINKPNTKKKFEVDEDKPKKKFVIEPGNWVQQRNANDCGPALILNALGELGVVVPDRNIEDVRNTVNRIRGSTPLPATGWFVSSDVGRYLSDVAGLRVEEYAANPYRKQEVIDAVEAVFRARAFDLLYITVGRHFRGILNKNNQLVLLDSFKSGPETVSPEDAWGLIERSINAGEGMRIERVGIVKRGEAAYLGL